MGRSLEARRWDPSIRLRAFAELENRPLPFRVSAFFIAIARKRGQCVRLMRVDSEIRRGARRLPSGTAGFASRGDDWDEHAFWQQGIDAWGVIAAAQELAIDVR